MSATTDIWERSNRSYIAVSVHYFDDNLKLHTDFIACERFTGRHTNDKVAEKLREIFDRFGILGKVFFITTDGAGEYTAAMKYFGDNYRSVQNLNSEVDFDWLLASNNPPDHSLNSDSVVSEDDDQNSDTDESLMVRDAIDLRTMPYTVAPSDTESTNTNDPRQDEERFIVRELFSSSESEPTDLLPNLNRIGCSAHLLDKLGKKDALNASSDERYANKYKQVFDKLEKIWDIKNSRLYAEAYSSITGHQILGPHRIRWSKTFDAVSCL